MRVAYAWLVVLVCGCSSGQSSGGGLPETSIALDGDGSRTDSEAVDSAADAATADTTSPPSDAASCHALEQKGSLLSFVAGGARPTMSGGSITDGTYVLHKLEWFDGGTPPSVLMAQTIAISGGVMQAVETDASETRRTTHSIKLVSAGSLQLVPVCPSDLSDNKPAPYNAAPAELILADDDFKVAFWFKKL